MTAQVGIGTTTPEGALDVVSANSGLIVPRVANTGAVTSPVIGMIIFDLSTDCLKVRMAGGWSTCFGMSASDVALAQIGNEADSPDATSSVTTIANLNAVFPALTGVIAAKEADYQRYIDGNPGAFSSPATQAEIQAMITAIAATDVVDPSGRIWMDRNLGASQVATSSTDAAAYGDLYQWGRDTDGHESRTSPVIGTESSGDTPGHGNFIRGGIDEDDWRDPQNDNLWQGGVNAINNPCPTGYRIPTMTELTELGITNASNAYYSPLKLPAAGSRYSSNGNIYFTYTLIWSSTVYNTFVEALRFTSTNSNTTLSYRATGSAVRCIKD